jgi:hypothetical protein
MKQTEKKWDAESPPPCFTVKSDDEELIIPTSDDETTVVIVDDKYEVPSSPQDSRKRKNEKSNKEKANRETQINCAIQAIRDDNRDQINKSDS